jgi:chromosome segregation ATPase
MKKLIALATVTVVATVGTVATTHPDDSRQLVDRLAATALRAWEGIEANPLPMLLALGTFLLTIAYHKMRGKSLRESVEVAATRVTVVPVPSSSVTAEQETAVVARAKARATRTQLIADQIGLENRYRKLPDEVKKAEKEACYTEEALSEACDTLEEKQKAHEEAVAKLSALRKELAEGEAEMAAIAAELKKLAELV